MIYIVYKKKKKRMCQTDILVHYWDEMTRDIYHWEIVRVLDFCVLDIAYAIVTTRRSPSLILCGSSRLYQSIFLRSITASRRRAGSSREPRNSRARVITYPGAPGR